MEAERILGLQALRLLLDEPDIETVLDVGSGAGLHAEIMREEGKRVTTISMKPPADWVGEFERYPVGYCEAYCFDALWASHVLEHSPHPQRFLQLCAAHLRPGGLLAVTVPPRKDSIVSGHLTLWNAGLLLYHLILAGFDCSSARVGTYGYNVSVLVRRPVKLLDFLPFATIADIAPYMPVPVKAGFNGMMPNVNWPDADVSDLP